MKQSIKIFGTVALLVMAMLFITGCTSTNSMSASQSSDAGVQKAVATVQTDENGHTLEQNNIIEKYKLDNDPATIRYVYLVSPMTNKVMLKMTMRGKVTSSGKRLTPNSIASGYPYGYYIASNGMNNMNYPSGNAYAMPVVINGVQYFTGEVIQDDGTYGNSAEYLYGFSMDGSMQQIYTGGATVIVSTKPLTIQDGVVSMQYVDARGNPISDIPSVNQTKI